MGRETKGATQWGVNGFRRQVARSAVRSGLYMFILGGLLFGMPFLTRERDDEVIIGWERHPYVAEVAVEAPVNVGFGGIGVILVAALLCRIVNRGWGPLVWTGVLVCAGEIGYAAHLYHGAENVWVRDAWRNHLIIWLGLTGIAFHVLVLAANRRLMLSPWPHLFVVATREGDERAQAIRQVGRLGDAARVPDVGSALTCTIQDPDPRIRGETVLALGRLGTLPNISVPNLLIGALEDSATSVRIRAAQAIWEVWPPARPNAIYALRMALRDDHYDVRRDAVTILGSLGRDALEVIPELEHSLSDVDEEVRQAASESLESLRAGDGKPT